MRKHVDECVGCTLWGLPCMGSSCRHKNVLRLYCDKCEGETQELFRLGDEEVCADCLQLYAEEKKCDRCGNPPYTMLYDFDGECLCEECLMKATRINVTEE